MPIKNTTNMYTSRLATEHLHLKLRLNV